MVKAVFFDIDDTLYNSSELAHRARANAVYAMIDAGLPVKDPRKAMAALNGVVKEYGSNYEHHFDALLDRLEAQKDPEIVAAGVVAYHDTKLSFLKSFPDTIPVLLSLRDQGYRLGVITEGRMVKQWEKLIRLGLHHFFDVVKISEEAGKSKAGAEIYRDALAEMNCMPGEAAMVGDRIDKDIEPAKRAGMKTILIRGRKQSGVKPDFEIDSLSELPNVLRKMK